ncbi:aminotransferase class I/II-fold pyridoxal phosphate-dependent enzyme [Arthrobacter sp. KBS0703]|uniref:aminotransferase class I/II-fold pyridoxal phosphate-dependent enzyme n=1 Tax=Arthrobacter sp. KBS0703 TaxID=1955698 RepID=UPI0021B0A37E|nr:aminotransferase class I/II-fold pyridoxal phosphate-dependent enzyme [Arthrobacter sp. KBS0703]
MNASMNQWLERQAAVRDRRGLVRRPLPRTADERFIDLASNDYLGLAADPRVAGAAAAAASLWGAGATSSRLVAGTTRLHLDLEEELALLAGMESALVFSSGYLANLGVITALGGPGTLIVADEHCHASMIDGFRLSRSRTESFTHNSVAEAGRLLADRPEPRAIIAVESVYSVLGDEAPLRDLLALAEEHDAVLLIDEAHSLGVTGTGNVQGRGSVAGTALAGHPNVIVTATLSKALGSQGGAVLGSALLREHLVNRARASSSTPAWRPPRQRRPSPRCGSSGTNRGARDPSEATLRRCPPGCPGPCSPRICRRWRRRRRPGGGGGPVHRHAVRGISPGSCRGRAHGRRPGRLLPPAVRSRRNFTPAAHRPRHPVSYTHLDVYKRQVLRGILEELP